MNILDDADHWLGSESKPRVFVTYGCHGNERASLKAGKEVAYRPSNYTLDTLCVNPVACSRDVRYIDRDIQDFFGKPLKQRATCREHARAQEVANVIGIPDLLIDLHTTTSNMGMTLNVSKWTPILASLCAKMSQTYADVRILYTPSNPDFATCLDTMSPNGLTFEAGSASRGEEHNLLADRISEILASILEFIDGADWDEYDGTPFPVFTWKKAVKYPTPKWDMNPDFVGMDYEPIPRGMLLMSDGDRRINMGNPKETLYACFIDEEAYKCEEEGWEAFDLMTLNRKFVPDLAK